jgi:flagellar hook-associated protein 2
MPGIQFGGLASGLDTAAIIEAILAVEGRTVRALEGRKSGEQQKLTLLGTFEGLVKTLQDKARDLRQASAFFAYDLTVGEEGVADFTLAGEVEAGAHTLEVLSLASADRYAFAGVTDPAASLGTGTVSFTYAGTAYSVDVLAGADSLNGIAAAINAAAGDDVTATVVNVGTSASPSYQLVLGGDDTGADFAITGLTSTVAGLSGATSVSTAANAQARVDGLLVERSSNLFSDVLPGVSFTVARTTTVGAPLTLTVELDPEGVRENVKGFVDAYNAVIEFVNDQNTFTLEGGAGGELFGDRALESVRTTLRRAVLEADRTLVGADTEGFASLGLLGIELQTDGTLDLDEDTLDEKLAANPELFSDFFRREDDALTADVDERGILVKLEEMLDDLLDAQTAPSGDRVDGLFTARRDSVNRQIRDFDRQIESQERRLESLESTLVAKFSALERLLSGLQSQSAFLTGSLQQS